MNDKRMLANNLLSAWDGPMATARRVVVAVSGGADSVAMLIAMIEAGWKDRLIVAHFNHRWRGSESEADQQFVSELCRTQNVPLALGARQAGRHQSDLSTSRESAMLSNTKDVISVQEQPCVKSEESARKLRYDFLIRTAYETGASYVATGHTADDRVETILHNVLRGTGLSGIASLNVFRNLHDDLVLVRPLLNAHRSEVESFLSSRGQSYRVDASNHSTIYARNFLRHELLPLARQRYPQLDQSLLSFSEVVEETLVELRSAAALWLDEVENARRAITPLLSDTQAGQTTPWPAHWNGANYWILPRSCLVQFVWPVLREALRAVWLKHQWPLGNMSREHWLTVREQLLLAPFSSKDCASSTASVLTVLPGGVQLEATRDAFALGRQA